MSRGHMPPQLLYKWSWAQRISDILDMILMPKNLALRLMISISLNFIWGSMNDMSFLTLLSLISIAIPGIAQLITKIILKFLYLDVLQTEDWLLPWLTAEESDLPDDYDDCAINEYFDLFGFDTKQVIKNLGSTLIYMAFITGSFLLVPIFLILLGCT